VSDKRLSMREEINKSRLDEIQKKKDDQNALKEAFQKQKQETEARLLVKNTLIIPLSFNNTHKRTCSSFVFVIVIVIVIVIVMITILVSEYWCELVVCCVGCARHIFIFVWFLCTCFGVCVCVCVCMCVCVCLPAMCS